MYFIGDKVIPIPGSRVKLTDDDKMLIRHRIVSCIHAVVCWIGGIYYIMFEQDLTEGHINTLTEIIICANTAGYMFSDMFYMWYRGFLDFPNITHHIGVGVVYMLPCFRLYCGNLCATLIFPGEVSNI